MITVAIAATLLWSFAPTAQAPHNSICTLGDGLYCLASSKAGLKPTVVRVEEPGGSNSSVTVPATPIVWNRYYIPRTAMIDPPPCRRERETATEIIVTHGAIWLVQVINSDTGELLAPYVYCEYPGDDPPQPPPMPQPPSEVDNDTQQLLALEIETNPPGDGFGGLTQLDTWLWCNDPGTINVEARTSRSIATAQVHLTNLTWTITGPSGTETHTSTDCGTEPKPSGTGDGAATAWKPTRTGDHLITLDATWNGTWTAQLYLDRYGWLTAGPFPLTPLTITNAPLTYPVTEIQTVGGRP